MINGFGELYSYKEQRLESLSDTPEDFSDYLPQDESAQALYRVYTTGLGKSPLVAARLVLEAAVGKGGKS